MYCGTNDEEWRMGQLGSFNIQHYIAQPYEHIYTEVYLHFPQGIYKSVMKSLDDLSIVRNTRHTIQYSVLSSNLILKHYKKPLHIVLCVLLR